MSIKLNPSLLAAMTRQLQRAKHYYLTVIFSLALTLTMVFSVFSILDVAFLQPLPYGESDELYYLEGSLKYQGQDMPGTNTQNLLALQQKNSPFTQLAIYFNWSEYKLYDDPSRPIVPVYLGSSNVFEVLQVEPLLGRFFNANEDLGNKQPSAVISYQLWQSHFAGDPAVIGKSIQLNQRRFSIIGVTPDNWVLPQKTDVASAIWLPMDMDEQLDPKTFGGYSGGVKALARLAPGITIEQANEQAGIQMAAAAQQNTPDIVKEYPISARVQDFTSAIRGDSSKIILMLVAGVILLTLIALINLGNLQLARAVGRVQSVAISYAFGATKRQLFKEIFQHNLLVIGSAAILALLLTQLTFDAIRTLGASVLPRLDAMGLSGYMLLFALGISLIISFIFSYIELKTIDETQLRASLQSSGKGTGKQLSKGMSHCLIGLQLLFSVLTLTASSQVLMASLTEALRPNNLVTDDLWSMVVHYAAIPTTEERVNLQRAIHLQLASKPEVLQVSRASEPRIPSPYNMDTLYNEAGDSISNSRIITVDEHYLPLYQMTVEGRFFTYDDLALTHKPVLINQRLASRLTGNPLGQKIMTGNKVALQIVGIVNNTNFPGDASYEGDELFLPGLYLGERTDTFLFKVSPDYVELSQAQMYAELLKIDPRLDLIQFAAVTEQFDHFSRNQRFAAGIAGAISLVSLIMVLAGINGMVSYMVRMRRYDLGVKLAMGATQKRLLRHQLLELASPIAAASLLAFSLAYFVIGYSRTLPEWHFTLYWYELILSLLTLLIFSMISCFLPVWQVLKTDPIKALRNE